MIAAATAPALHDPPPAADRPAERPPVPPPGPIAPDAQRLKEFAARWFAAHLMLNARRRERVTLVSLGREIADVRGLDEPRSQSSMHRIEAAQQWPDPGDVEAFCLICQAEGLPIDPGWMMFGNASNAERPDERTLALLDSAPYIRAGRRQG